MATSYNFEVNSSRTYLESGIILSDNYPASRANLPSHIVKNFNAKTPAYKIYLTDIDMGKVDDTTSM